MNAVCERSHATANSMLAKCVADNHWDWDKRLPQVAFCYNASTHESTQFSPFFLMHGMEPRWDVDLCLEDEVRTPYTPNAYADLLIHRLESAHTLIRDSLQTTASRMSDWYDRKVKAQDFQVGDEVFVLNLCLYQRRCPKWVRRYSDVAVVVKKINQVTYIVRSDEWRSKEKIVHVDKLKLKTRVGGGDTNPSQ